MSIYVPMNLCHCFCWQTSVNYPKYPFMADPKATIPGDSGKKRNAVPYQI